MLPTIRFQKESRRAVAVSQFGVNLIEGPSEALGSLQDQLLAGEVDNTSDLGRLLQSSDRTATEYRFCGTRSSPLEDALLVDPIALYPNLAEVQLTLMPMTLAEAEAGPVRQLPIGVLYDGTYVVGPWIDPRSHICLKCTTRRLLVNWGAPVGSQLRNRVVPLCMPSAADLMACLPLASQIVQHGLGAEAISIVFNPATDHMERQFVYPMNDCEQCNPCDPNVAVEPWTLEVRGE